MDIRQTVIDLLARRKAAVAEHEAAMTKFSQDLDDMQQQILAGTSTAGDPIADFVFLFRGQLGEVENPYRSLQAEFAGKTGQLFLVIARTSSDQMVKSGFEPVFRPVMDVQKYVGILAGEKLEFDLKDRSYGMPATRSMKVLTSSDERSSARALRSGTGEGTLWLSRFQFPPLEHRNKQISVGSEIGNTLEILIGDEAVLDSCPVQESATCGAVEDHMALRRAVRALGRELPLSATEEEVRLQVLAEGLRTLGELSSVGFRGQSKERGIEIIRILREQGHGENEQVIAFATVLRV